MSKVYTLLSSIKLSRSRCVDCIFILASALIAYFDRDIMLRGWSDSFSVYSFLTSYYMDGKIPTIESHGIIAVDLFIPFLFWSQLHLLELIAPYNFVISWYEDCTYNCKNCSDRLLLSLFVWLVS